MYISKIKLAAIALSFFSSVCIAADTISHAELEIETENDTPTEKVLGKKIIVHAKSFGELGFQIKKVTPLTFLCESGEKSLTSKKPKPVTFEGTIINSQYWEGYTVWSLSNCKTISKNKK